MKVPLAELAESKANVRFALNRAIHKIRAAETREQKHDRRDARLVLNLLVMQDRFPEIWMPSTEQRDLRTLLRDRHQWVKCERDCSTPYRQSLAIMPCSTAMHCGVQRDRAHCEPCLCHPTQVKDEMSY